jgi:hypothetical protein
VANAQSLSPLTIAEKYFSSRGFKGWKVYMSGEMLSRTVKDSTFGQYLSRKIKRKASLISEDSSTAVVTVLVDDGKRPADYYLYFIKEHTWKLEAIRSLSLTGLAYEFIKEIERLPADSFARLQTELTLRETYLNYQNAKLIVSPDEVLIKYANTKRKQLDSMVNYLQQMHYTDSARGERMAIRDTAFRKKLQAVYIRSVHFSHTKKGSITFSIGGMSDNEVGFFYTNDPKNVPKISKDRVIIIRPIGDGWYLYKTT